MSISTTDKPEDKREKLRKLREFHQPALDELGVPDAFFIPKMAYKPIGKYEKYIAFFNSEISKGNDVYVEFCSRDHDPEYEDRGLYKWKYNQYFETEYEKTEPNVQTGHHRYLVPIAELIKVKDYSQPAQAEISFNELPDPDLDLPLDQITIRDLAAILLKKPVSMKPWLNDIITK